MALASEEILRKEEPDEGREARTILRQDPRRGSFPYAKLDGKHEMLFIDEEVTLAAFLRGEDQGSWERLIGLVEGNLMKAAKGDMKSESKGVESQVRS